MDAGFQKWLGETRGFKPGDLIRTQDQFNALYRLYLNETTAGGARQNDASGGVQQIMQQAQAPAAASESDSVIGSFISSLFGGNDPGRPVPQPTPEPTQAAPAGGSRRSASALLDAALQDSAAPVAVERPQLPTGGRVAYEEAVPMEAMTNAPTAEALLAAPTPLPQEQFVGETFTQDQFRQMTGRDLAAGEYLDAQGRPFLVK
jgi:hypothetical protein